MTVTTLSDIPGFLRRNRVLIAAVACFVMFWMLVYTFGVYKPGYVAKSVVIIKDSAITARFVEPEQYYAIQTTSSSSSNPVLNTMGILKSNTISADLYEYFRTRHPEQLKKNRIKTKADWEKFFGDGSSFIQAKNQPGTDLIAIEFTWSKPEIAQEGLEVVVKSFQEASRDLNKADQISRTQFLEKQVVEIEAQLEEIRSQKSAYQRKTGTVSVAREGSDLAATRIELRNRLSQTEAQARGQEQVLRRYQKMLGMSPEKALAAAAMGQNDTLARMQDELYRLNQQYSQLNATLTETNPKVLEIQAQIEQVKVNIEAEKARTMGKTRPGAENAIVADRTRGALVDAMMRAQGEVQDLRAQAAVLRERLGQVDVQIKEFPGVAEDLANIEQKEASLSTALDHMRQKVIEGRLKEEQTLSNVFVVDAPRLPNKASFPNQIHMVLLSVLLGLGSGVAVAFGKEQLLADSGNTLPAWLEPVEDQPIMPQPTAKSQPAFVETVPALHPATQPKPPAHRPAAHSPHPQAGPERRISTSVPVPSPSGPVPAVKTNAAQIPLQGAGTLRRDLMQPLPPQPMRNPIQRPEPKPSAQPVARTAAPIPARQQVASPSVQSGKPPSVKNSPQPAPAPAPDTPKDKSAEQALPFPRRTRSLPAFLLDESSPQKPLLAPGDDLMRDVSPIGPPPQARKPLGVAPQFFRKPSRKSARPGNVQRKDAPTSSLARSMQALHLVGTGPQAG